MLHSPRHIRPTFDHISDIHFPTFINIFITFDNIPAPPPTINPTLNHIVRTYISHFITFSANIWSHFGFVKIPHLATLVYIFSHHDTLYYISDIASHYFTLHYITTLHHKVFHKRHHITSHWITSYHISLHYITSQLIKLQHLHDVVAQFHHCFLHAMPTTTCVGKAFKKLGRSWSTTSWRCCCPRVRIIILHYIILHHSISLNLTHPYILVHYITSHNTVSHHITSHHITFKYIT